MDKIRFAIVGSGWRSLFYVRIAKSYPELFDLAGMLCRTEEKALRLSREYSIRTFLDEQELFSLKPDFVVVAVNKASISQVSLHILEKGIPVLCETPAAMTEEDLDKLWDAHLKGGRLFVAEQYPFLPDMSALINELNSNLIGNRYSLYLSRAHEYHGFALMRALLGIGSDQGFSIRAVSQTFPVARTKDRYNTYEDGLLKESLRTAAYIAFDNGKSCLYDFEGEEYHSSIRDYSIRVSGDRGEFKDGKFTYLDENNRVTEKTHDENKAEVNPDEAAIKALMEKIKVLLCEERASSEEKELLSSALQDAYSAILLRQATQSPDVISSCRKRWNI